MTTVDVAVATVDERAARSTTTRRQVSVLCGADLAIALAGVAVLLAGFAFAPVVFVVLATLTWASGYAVFDFVRSCRERDG